MKVEATRYFIHGKTPPVVAVGQVKSGKLCYRWVTERRWYTISTKTLTLGSTVATTSLYVTLRYGKDFIIN